MSDRPVFHLTAPYGWLNDPNGLGRWEGTYHAFYQHNPHACVHGEVRGNTYWGHATSPDLVHWEHHPIALSPDPDGPDRDGCWSGALVDDGGVPTLVYSGHVRGRTQLPCLATSSDGLRTFTQDPANPVIAGPPPGLGVTEFRDHNVWREGDRWRQVVSAAIPSGGAALLYEGTDLRTWTYVGELVRGPLGPTGGDQATGERGPGDVWECVELVRLTHLDPPHRQPHDLLLWSQWFGGETLWTCYATGTYDGDVFRPLRTGILDAGLNYFYAPQTLVDAQGRRVMIGWLQEGRSDEACEADGWSGALSVPRVLTVDEAGEVHQHPLPELAVLRGEERRIDVAGGTALAATEEPAADLDVWVRLEPDAELRVHVRGETLRVRREGPLIHATWDRGDGRRGTATRPYPADGAAVRVLVDHSAVEAFVEGAALTMRAYGGPDGVRVEAGAGAQVTGALWPLAAAVPPAGR